MHAKIDNHLFIKKKSNKYAKFSQLEFLSICFVFYSLKIYPSCFGCSQPFIFLDYSFFWTTSSIKDNRRSGNESRPIFFRSPTTEAVSAPPRPMGVAGMVFGKEGWNRCSASRAVRCNGFRILLFYEVEIHAKKNSVLAGSCHAFGRQHSSQRKTARRS